MTAHDSRHRVDMPINLLAALGAFASKNGMHSHLHGVFVRKLELVACDGHRLVCVDMIHEAFRGSQLGDVLEREYLIPDTAIAACVAAAKAVRANRVAIQYDGPTPSATSLVLSLSLTVRSAGGHNEFTMQVRAPNVDYPPTDQLLLAASTPTDKPPALIINPRLLADVAPVLDALDIAPREGVRIVGWGDNRAPLHLKAPGVRFVVMPMTER